MPPTGLKFYFGFGSTNMPRRRRWGREVAKRRDENSPAIHGCVRRQSNGKVPQGTVEKCGGRPQRSFVPGGTLDDCGHRVPAMNGWAIVR